MKKILLCLILQGYKVKLISFHTNFNKGENNLRRKTGATGISDTRWRKTRFN